MKDPLISAIIPIRTRNPNNGATGHSRTAGIIRSKERHSQRDAARMGLFLTTKLQAAPRAMLPVVATVVRLAPGNGLDPHDGLRAALKGVVDGVADWLGLDNDRDPRVTWEYDQRRSPKGIYAVEIRIDRRAS